MKRTSTEELRKSTIWMALSELYLDTELLEPSYKDIAREFTASNISIKEAMQINRREVYPVLYLNLRSVVGEWQAFNEGWLLQNIKHNLLKEKRFKNVWLQMCYWQDAQYFNKAFKRIENHLHKI